MVRKRHYTETEKLGTLVLALEEGIPTASEVTHTPERTIYQWFRDAGGIAEIRTFTEAATLQALASSSRALCEEVRRRAERQELSDAELMMTYRKLIETAASGQGNAPSATGAAAQSVLHVHVGPDEVVEVPRES